MPLNPLSYPANPSFLASVLALDPAIAGERRLQSLLHIWLSRYFSGTAFTTRTVGGTAEKTFPACHFAWQEAPIPETPTLPVLHLVIPDVRGENLDYGPQATGHTDTWFLQLMVRITPALTLTTMPGIKADDIAREVAGQAQWLLGSSEREALEEHGIFRLEARPAVLLPSADWKMRLIAFSCQTRRENAR